MSRVGVVLFNLGGPDSLEAVRPFLVNLFSDPAVIGASGPVRWILARLIAARRAPVARDIYHRLGGGSPILPLTRDQAAVLTDALAARTPETEWRVTIAMRCWHPLAAEAATELAEFRPDRVVLLPLYPQYSVTTTESSAIDWAEASRKAGLAAPTSLVCCYPTDDSFIAAETALIAEAIATARERLRPAQPLHVLFSAHGLPRRTIAGGDPYQWQVERTVAAVTGRLHKEGIVADGDGTEIITCYQSRVGPLEWIGPATDAEITRAGRAGAGLVVIPIAFVSEHSETLVELDMQYRELAEREGAGCFVRVPALGTHRDFIDGLARLVVSAVETNPDRGLYCPARPGGLCPGAFGGCPWHKDARS